MAKINVKFLAAFRDVVGKNYVDVTIEEGETVEELLKRLCNQFGKKLRNLIFRKNDSITNNVVIFVNGRNILTLDGLKTKLKDDDYLILSTPLTGG